MHSQVCAVNIFQVPNQCAEVSGPALLERCSKLLDFAGVCTIRNAIDTQLTSRCSTAADDLAKDVRQLLVNNTLKLGYL